jgi:hypothetical protein
MKYSLSQESDSYSTSQKSPVSDAAKSVLTNTQKSPLMPFAVS